MSSAAPRDGFPAAGLAAPAVRTEIAALCAGDHSYAGGSIFNSICSAPLPLGEEVLAESLHKNLGDDRLFPGPREAERRVTAMLADLLGCPAAQGCLVSGGTEANLLAMSLAVEEWRRCGGDGRPEILAPETVHFSFDKIARLLDARLVRTGLDARLRGDLRQLARHAGPCTAALVVSAGASETGAVDDVEAAAEIAGKHGLHLHVDAATGGFLIPFAGPEHYRGPRIDFAVPAVRSITLDPHKYGYAPIPAGYLLVRRAEDFARLRVPSYYAGTHDHHTLLGTRPGGAALAVYAVLRHLGRAGYAALVAELFARRAHLLRLLAEHGFTLAAPPDLTVVAVQVADVEGMVRDLAAQGIIVSASRRFDFLRIVVQRHLGERDLERLVAAMTRVRPREEVSA